MGTHYNVYSERSQNLINSQHQHNNPWKVVVVPSILLFFRLMTDSWPFGAIPPPTVNSAVQLLEHITAVGSFTGKLITMIGCWSCSFASKSRNCYIGGNQGERLSWERACAAWDLCQLCNKTHARCAKVLLVLAAVVQLWRVCCCMSVSVEPDAIQPSVYETEIGWEMERETDAKLLGLRDVDRQS